MAGICQVQPHAYAVCSSLSTINTVLAPRSSAPCDHPPMPAYPSAMFVQFPSGWKIGKSSPWHASIVEVPVAKVKTKSTTVKCCPTLQKGTTHWGTLQTTSCCGTALDVVLATMYWSHRVHCKSTLPPWKNATSSFCRTIWWSIASRRVPESMAPPENQQPTSVETCLRLGRFGPTGSPYNWVV